MVGFGLRPVLVLVNCLWCWFLATWSPDNLQQRLETGAEILVISRAIGNTGYELDGHNMRIIGHLEAADLNACEQELDASTRIAEKWRDPYYQRDPAATRAALATLQGRFEEGERWAHRVLELNQRVGDPDSASIFGVQLALLRWEQARLSEIESFAKGFVDEYPTIPSWRASLAWICRELGKESEARREFEVIAGTEFSSLRKDNSYLLALALLSNVAAFLRDPARIEMLYGMLSPYSDRAIVVTSAIGCAGPVSLYLGILATALEQWSDAEQHFAKAGEIAQRLGSQPFHNRAKYEHARMLLARNSDGGREAAQSLLERAISDARSIGQDGVAVKAAALQRQVAAN